jgi:hypothetical protein
VAGPERAFSLDFGEAFTAVMLVLEPLHTVAVAREGAQPKPLGRSCARAPSKAANGRVEPSTYPRFMGVSAIPMTLLRNCKLTKISSGFTQLLAAPARPPV